MPVWTKVDKGWIPDNLESIVARWQMAHRVTSHNIAFMKKMVADARANPDGTDFMGDKFRPVEEYERRLGYMEYALARIEIDLRKMEELGWINKDYT
jgi:hypothetical protein